MRIHLVKTAAGSTPSWMLPVYLLDCVELTYPSVVELNLPSLDGDPDGLTPTLGLDDLLLQAMNPDAALSLRRCCPQDIHPSPVGGYTAYQWCRSCVLLYVLISVPYRYLLNVTMSLCHCHALTQATSTLYSSA